MLRGGRFEAALLGVVIVAGSLLRTFPSLGSEFPVSDGGLFMVMVDEIRANGMALPAFTAYNDASIPFVYPPLGLYAAAVVSAFGASTVDVLRLAPAVFTIATIPVMYLIGRRLLDSAWLAIAATAIFAFTTGSYEWLVMGGGLTRGLGFLMALIAVDFAIRTYRELRVWTAVACGIALGAAALSHPQAAVFGALSVPLLLPFTAMDRGRAIRLLLVVIGVAAIVVSPWLGVVLIRHGPDPLLSALSTGGAVLAGVISLASSRTSGGFTEVIGVATTFGLIICTVRRFWLPPVWALAIVIADSRAGQPYLSVPAALATAFLLGDLARVVRCSVASGTAERWARHAPAIVAGALIFAAFFDSLASQFTPGSPLRSLSAEIREAMAWVKRETAEDARFVVLSGWYWAIDAEAEWFPALAERQSLGTVQGTEWVGDYSHRVDRAGELAVCVVEGDATCVEDWFAEAGDVDYLFLVDTPLRELDGVSCCHQLQQQLSATYDTEAVYRQSAVLIVGLTPRSR